MMTWILVLFLVGANGAISSNLPPFHSQVSCEQAGQLFVGAQSVPPSTQPSPSSGGSQFGYVCIPHED
jgi:hypothetical protein